MTRLYNTFFSKRFRKIKFKTRYLQQNILNMLCVSLIGFLSGNLFGTVLTPLRECIVWDGFIIACLIAVIEMISYFSYNPARYRLKISMRWKICKNLNIFKIGIMIGFFVDAFKVGS